VTVHLDSVSTLAATAGDDADTAATQLEAYFLRRMLSEMTSTESSELLGGGFAGQMFQEMLDEALADSMAEAGGLGIADIVAADMRGERATLRPGKLSHAPAHAAAVYRTTAPRLSVAPVDGAASSSWGKRTDPIDGTSKFHAGLDLAAAADSPVRAAGSGVVTRAGAAGGYGNLVVVDHGGGLETRYAHLAHIKVEVGQTVGPGDVVGGVGATGRATGPHLHFEVRRDGHAVDPKGEIPGLKTAGKRPNP
jgi:murein DD-endopeptidase MepM/ murein hydrolase activator NlpD